MSEQNLPQQASKSSFKMVMFSIVFFMLLAVVLTTLLMPKVIGWYFEPPAAMGISCGPSIRWAVERFVFAQLISVLIGAIIGLLVGFRFKKS